MGILIYPLVFILSISLKLLSKIFRLKAYSGPPVTEEELKILIKEGSDHGVLEKEESEMMREVLKFGDKTAYHLMTPSSDIIFLDKNDPQDKILSLILDSGFSRFPVCDDTIDHVIGIIDVKEVLRKFSVNRAINLQENLSPPLYIPEVMPALDVLELFREKKVHIGIVVNEFGTTEGLITLHDISESILGDFPAFFENEPPDIFYREDGSLLVDGTIQLDDLKEELKIREFPISSESENISTLGGLAMILLNKVPEEGDHFELSGYRFEIMDMDGQRVDKVLVSEVK
jgi:putative hemolysin